MSDAGALVTKILWTFAGSGGMSGFFRDVIWFSVSCTRFCGCPLCLHLFEPQAVVHSDVKIGIDTLYRYDLVNTDLGESSA